MEDKSEPIVTQVLRSHSATALRRLSTLANSSTIDSSGFVSHASKLADA